MDSGKGITVSGASVSDLMVISNEELGGNAELLVLADDGCLPRPLPRPSDFFSDVFAADFTI